MLLSSWSIYKTSALLLRLVNLNLSIPVYYHILIFSFSEGPNFRHHPKLCSECSTLLTSSLNGSLICWENSLLSFESRFCRSNAGFNFPCTCCFVCYQDNKVVEIFHIFRLFWSITICFRDRCLEIFIILVPSPPFIFIPYFLRTSIRLLVISCNTVSSWTNNTRSSEYCTVRIICPSIWSIKTLQELPW